MFNTLEPLSLVPGAPSCAMTVKILKYSNMNKVSGQKVLCIAAMQHGPCSINFFINKFLSINI